jgi:YCII-related domain
MRVMVLVKATEDSEKLVNAGIMRAAGGLKHTDRTVIDGPFAETRKLVAGFWPWEVKDMDEANRPHGWNTRITFTISPPAPAPTAPARRMITK